MTENYKENLKHLKKMKDLDPGEELQGVRNDYISEEYSPIMSTTFIRPFSQECYVEIEVEKKLYHGRFCSSLLYFKDFDILASTSFDFLKIWKLGNGECLFTKIDMNNSGSVVWDQRSLLIFGKFSVLHFDVVSRKNEMIYTVFGSEEIISGVLKLADDRVLCVTSKWERPNIYTCFYVISFSRKRVLDRFDNIATFSSSKLKMSKNKENKNLFLMNNGLIHPIGFDHKAEASVNIIDYKEKKLVQKILFEKDNSNLSDYETFLDFRGEEIMICSFVGENHVEEWNLFRNKKIRRIILCTKEPIWNLLLISNGKYIIGGCGDGKLRLIDLAKKKHLEEFDLGIPIKGIDDNPIRGIGWISNNGIDEFKFAVSMNLDQEYMNSKPFHSLAVVKIKGLEIKNELLFDLEERKGFFLNENEFFEKYFTDSMKFSINFLGLLQRIVLLKSFFLSL